MESLFVALTCAHDALKRLFAMARTPISKTMAPAVIFRISKDCRSELAVFGRTALLVVEVR